MEAVAHCVLPPGSVMNKFLTQCIISFLLLPVTLNGLTAQTAVPVFTAGKEGYQSYRIPAIIRLKDHSLLAFCEGRLSSAADFGNIDIVMKRSSDLGKTWTPLQVIVNESNLQAGNPAPVVDWLDPDFPDGRIFLFYNTGTNHEAEVARGNGIRECKFICSTDGGISWSAPVNITRQVHRPLQEAINPAYRFREDWRTYANTPGHGLQISEGPYKGRIYIAANHSEASPQPGAGHYRAHGYYSDDHGRSFQLAASLPFPGSNESTAAMLDNGGLLLNARNQSGTPRVRIVARSKDGGSSWDSVYFDHQLPDPVCQGTLLNAGKIRGRNVLLFCNAGDSMGRDQLTLRISRDEGRTWTRSILIDKDPMPRKNHDYTAYSDMVMTAKRETAVLYERNNYSEIVYRIINW